MEKRKYIICPDCAADNYHVLHYEKVEKYVKNWLKKK